MEDEFQKFYNLIQAHYADQSSDKSETATEILKYTSRIEYLDFLQQFLGKCLDSNQHILVTFNFMREIIKFRGCLMSIEELLNHFMFLKQFIINNYQRLLSNQALVRSASQDVAMTIRFTYEQNTNEGDVLFTTVKELFDSDGDIKAIALIIMTAIVDCFKESLMHLSFSEKTNIIQEFKNKYLHIFLITILPLIMEGSGLILYSALELLLHCFDFCESSNKSSTISVISYPKEFSHFFLNLDIVNRIFDLCFIQETSDLSYKLLYYMAAASNVWDMDPEKKANYFNFFTFNMIRIITSQSNESSFIDQTSLIMNILSKNLEPEQFFQNNFAQEFLTVSLQFSGLVFATGETTSLQNIFNFWSKVSSWKLNIELMKIITETMFQLIASFIDSTLNAISQNAEDWLQLFKSEFANGGFETIWKIALNCYDRVYLYILEKIALKSSENPTNFLQLTFLIMVISSRFGKSFDPSADNNVSKLYESVINLIQQTTPLIKQILAQDPSGIVFENSIVRFMFNYQLTHFSGTSVLSNTKDPDIIKAIAYKQNIIDIFITRILNDFDSFQFICTFPNLPDRIFMLVTQLIKKNECVELISNTPIKEALLTQNLSISFDGVPLDIAKHSRINLYFLYTSLIKNVKELQIFLSKFDIRFQQLAESNYTDQNEIFALFCDLRGVFKYLLTGTNQSAFDDTIKNYVRICNWFSTNHVQDSVEIIKNNPTDTFIVKIVCCIWISLFPDRFDTKNTQNQLINDGFGIILFKTSLIIVETVVQSSANDYQKFYTLFKVIRYCMTTKYANFGVMNYYGDNSFDRMSALFFQLLVISGFDNLAGNLKLLNHILLTMNAITESEKCLNELFGSEDQSSLNLILSFTEKCMYLDSHNRETSVSNSSMNQMFGIDKNNYKGSESVTLVHLWINSWKVLSPLLNKSLSTPELMQSIQMYRPHSVLILNNVMMKNDTKQIELAPILLATYIYDNQFANWLLSIVIGTYDDKFKKYVQDQFFMVFNDFYNAEVPIPMTVDAVKEFKDRLKRLSTAFKKYQTNFIDLPQVAQIL